jgi:hypothetical protein
MIVLIGHIIDEDNSKYKSLNPERSGKSGLASIAVNQ